MCCHTVVVFCSVSLCSWHHFTSLHYKVTGLFLKQLLNIPLRKTVVNVFTWIWNLNCVLRVEVHCGHFALISCTTCNFVLNRWSKAGSDPGKWCLQAMLLWPHAQQPIPDQRSHRDARHRGTFCFHHWHDMYVINNSILHYSCVCFLTLDSLGHYFPFCAPWAFTHVSGVLYFLWFSWKDPLSHQRMWYI